MSEIIDFFSKSSIKVPTKENPVGKFIEEILKDRTDIEALMVAFKYENDEVELFRSDNFNIKDRSFLVQLMESDIQDELSPTCNAELEPDL